MDTVRDALWIHCGVQGVILVGAAMIAWRRDLIHWRSSTFWALLSFSLFFLLHPLVSLLIDDLTRYAKMLAFSGGASRVTWVTIVVAVGLIGFFLSNLRPRSTTLPESLRREAWRYPWSWPPGTSIIVFVSMVAAVYSLYYFRSAFGYVDPLEAIADDRRFVGEVTGYQVVIHMLALYPIILFILTEQVSLLGWVLFVLYSVAKVYDPWGRMTLVSLCIAVATAQMVKGERSHDMRRRWPHRAIMVAIVLFTLALQLRAHKPADQWVAEEPTRELRGAEKVLASQDTSMLSTLYLESYLDEKRGWTYATDFLGKIIFGPLPRKLFPWKDDYIKWLGLGSHMYLSGEQYIFGQQYMQGQKSSVIGNFYKWGGITAVFFGMLLLGWVLAIGESALCMDSATPVCAMFTVWYSMLWMMLGSSFYWTLLNLVMGAGSALVILGIHFFLRIHQKNLHVSMKRF